MDFTHFLTNYLQLTLGAGLVFALLAVLYLSQRMNKLLKRREEEQIYERLKLLEEEIEEYMERSHRRLDVFKKVIDGFDHIIQGVRGVIDEEEKVVLHKTISKEKQDLIDEQDKKEAEIIHLDSSIDEK